MSVQTYSQERLLRVILSPLISEKATNIADANEQIAFKVATDATKGEIKAAVESIFEVKVKSVCTVKQKGKVKRRGMTLGRRADTKKAYVCLEPGQEINFAGTD